MGKTTFNAVAESYRQSYSKSERLFENQEKMSQEEQTQILLAHACIESEENIINTGIFISIKNKKWILANSEFLKDKKTCEKSKVSFYDNGGDWHEAKLSTDDLIIDTDLKVAAIPCDVDDKFVPVDVFYEDDPNEDTKSVMNSLYCNYFNSLKDLISPELKHKKKEIFDIHEDLGDQLVPIFYEEKLFGMQTHGKGGVRISKIIEKIFAEDDDGDVIFEAGNTVGAEWNDGYYYQAKLINQTELGWKISWVEFDGEDDLPKNKFKKTWHNKSEEKNDTNN